MEPFKLKDQQILQIEKWQRLSNQLVAGVTTKNGGVSKGEFSSFNCGLHVEDITDDVIKNRTLLANLTEFSLSNWVAGEQVHDMKIQYVTYKNRGCGATSTATALPGIDGILTKEPGILLTAFFADCIPLYFFDPEVKMVGIAHAGWKGTVKGIAGKMIAQFQQYGSKLENILVTIGPGISQDYYEVDNHVVSQINEEFRTRVLVPTDNNRYLLDLKELNREILLHYGLLRHNIDMTEYCTYRDNNLFFSYRRDEGKTGRMLGFIGFRE